jgi:hypothetical protein
MFLWLFQHNWKTIKRSPDFGQKVIGNILFGFFIFLFMLQLLLLGYFLNRMIREDIKPGSDPVAVINGILLFYFGSDFVLKLNFQKIRSALGRQYLLMRVNRSAIAHFVLMKTPGTTLNIFPFFILIPFFFKGVLPAYGFVSSFAWLVSFIGCLAVSTYAVNYAKIRFFKNSVRISIAAGIIIIAVLLQKLDVFSLTPLSATLFGFVLRYPALALLPVLFAGMVYSLNHKMLTDFLYLENLDSDKQRGKFKESFGFLTGLGEIGTLISIDIKLMLRNKRAKIALWMPFLFVFYGLFFYPSGHYTRGDGVTDFMLIFVGTFITGFFVISYGMTTFSYESSHFGFLLTRRINMLTYLRARYYFMTIMASIAYLFSIFYIYYGIKIFLTNTVMFLFNVGASAFIFLFLATFNTIKFDLSMDAFSLQGKGTTQFTAVFMLMIILLIIYLPFRLMFDNNAGLYALGAIGIAGIILHPWFLQMLVQRFYSRKYIMSEGFRHT